jgi:hypothetical protein
MLRYSGKEIRYECKICKSLFHFNQIIDDEKQKKYWEGLEKHRLYEVHNSERETRNAFICEDCLSFFNGLVKECVSNLQSGKKAESK